MEASEFVELVKRMRLAQRAYFRSRQSEDLQASKRLEREVDAAIAEKDSDTRQRSLPL